MYAARTGNIGMIELCIVAGTGINRTNSDGWTPLTFAAKHGHLQAVEFLVSTGADINIRQIQAKRCLN
jgi:ankyrin repeat protein